MTMPSPGARPASEVYARALEVALAAEQGGRFSHLWLAEHHFTNYAYSSRPLLLLAYLAARTRSIRLGPAIIPVPLHHPLLVAEELATIDVLSGGRLDVGLGKGYQQYQYDRFGMHKGDDPARYAEGVDVIAAALRGEIFSYEGTVFSVPPTRLYPEPLQQPPPLWLVVNTTVPASVEEAVRRGMNLFTGVGEPISRLTNVRTAYPTLFSGAEQRLRIGTQRPVYVAENDADARMAAEEARWNVRVSVAMRYDLSGVEHGVVDANEFPGEPTLDDLLENVFVIGTPEQCIRQLRRIRDGLGCDYFSASFWFGNLSHGKVLASMARFEREVLPAFANG
ncbi:MAG: LLM class flavin-dependent oxidoreductase [Candidatus Eremiobacteraeota bacterium]|nr:LLM class flavin-dependent oxidoreductase [Candidatus Eremiobacteraeota bacterium]